MKRAASLSILLLLLATSLAAQPEEENRRYKLAQGYEESGDLPNAARVYKELYDDDQGSNVYYAAVWRTYITLRRFEELLPIVESRSRRLSRDVGMRSQYADILSRNNRRDDAVREWHGAIELRPDDPGTYETVAQAQIDNRLFDLAAQTFRLGRQHMNDPTLFADHLSQLYGVLGRFEEATEEYIGLLDHDPSRLNFVMGGLGLFTTNTDGADAAIKVARRHLERRPDYTPYLDLLSWLYIERRDYDGALEIAKQLDKVRNGRGSDIYGFADGALREGKYDAAMKALEYFMNTYPKTNPLYGSVLLAYTKAMEGRYRALATRSKRDAEDLIERYRTIARENTDGPSAPEALLQVARLQADELDEPKEAIATINALRDAYPSFPAMPEAGLLEGDLNLRVGNVDRARELYEAGAAELQSGEDGERYRDLSALRRAEVRFFQRQFKEATDLFGTLSENSASEVANDALGYLFLLQDNAGRNDSALVHYAAGTLLLRQRKWSEAIAEMEKAVAMEKEGTVADEALFGKAQAEEALGDAAGASATLLGIVTKYADGSIADRALFHAAEITEGKLADGKKALELYTRLLTEFPTSPFMNRARARIRVLREKV
jgi:tetratricopeptide (TPR) repeat protein